jgi:hypothetical protein
VSDVHQFRAGEVAGPLIRSSWVIDRSAQPTGNSANRLLWPGPAPRTVAAIGATHDPRSARRIRIATASVANTGTDGFALPPRKIWQVIGASSAGTVIEWYDFYIFGALVHLRRARHDHIAEALPGRQRHLRPHRLPVALRGPLRRAAVRRDLLRRLPWPRSFARRAVAVPATAAAAVSTIGAASNVPRR